MKFGNALSPIKTYGVLVFCPDNGFDSVNCKEPLFSISHIWELAKMFENKADDEVADKYEVEQNSQINKQRSTSSPQYSGVIT
ncbi:Hypothetical protein CINCED_3A014337 [Cinara cedri]|uniref:Uncharacterized protein n=1 Tax=Cinara cedri TaxID=506608 RepID=A0A5E4NQY5_9HEMI|nr:Hypothetical protein CINCED_3A014337 [Cinara cedri]